MSSSFTTSPASGVSGDAPPPHIVEDCLGLVQLLSDGTVKRAPATLVLHDDAPPPKPDNGTPVRWKDVVYDEARNLSLRMYVPTSAVSGDGGAEKKKLPVLVYFHGGGFIIGSFASPEFHSVGLRLATELPAIVLSADYRLAPEHRLPAALEDADTLLSWLGDQEAAAGAGADAWLADAADLGRVFVSGDSAGANIAHHAVVRAVASGRRLCLAGCVLLWPYFGGERRTASEAACPGDVFLTLPLSDQMWRLALPAGATRDHPFANPFGPEMEAAGGSTSTPVGELPPLLVAIGDGDMLIDRVREYVARVRAEDNSRRVDLVEFPGAGHGFPVFEPDGEAAGELVRVVRRFVHGGGAAAAAPAPRTG